jgi:hypothetical protein
MTRPFNAQFHCPNCKTFVSAETSFGRWIRNNNELESRNGYCVTDQDYWIHKFKNYGSRKFQCIVGVEIKTMGADVSDSQRDILMLINQLMRNRKITPTSGAPWQSGNGITTVKSIIAKSDVFVKAFGIHTLRFSGLGPDDSEWIMWDKKEIDVDILTKILRFDLDPDSLYPLDLRSHHLTCENQNMNLFSDD